MTRPQPVNTVSATPRRSFLKTGATGLLAAPFIMRDLLANPPSGQVLHASFGASGMAWADLNAIASHPKVRMVAVAEADAGRTAEFRKRFPDAKVYEDYRVLLEREKLGTTGVGHGIAIPHGKMAKLDRLYGVFARLEKPIDLESLDGEPVDLVFLLLAPEGAGADHLKALSRVARALRDPAIAQKLRKTKDADALFALLTQSPTASAA